MAKIISKTPDQQILILATSIADDTSINRVKTLQRITGLAKEVEPQTAFEAIGILTPTLRRSDAYVLLHYVLDSFSSLIVTAQVDN